MVESARQRARRLSRKAERKVRREIAMHWTDESDARPRFRRLYRRYMRDGDA